MSGNDVDLSKILSDYREELLPYSPLFPTPYDNNDPNNNWPITENQSQTDDRQTTQPKVENASPPTTVDQAIFDIQQFLRNDPEFAPLFENAPGLSFQYDPSMGNFLSASLAASSSPQEGQSIDNLLGMQHVVQTQQQLLLDAQQADRTGTTNHPQATAASPINYDMYAGGCQPFTTVEMGTDSYPRYEQVLEFDADTKKIRIRNQPRGQFRPRTGNESRSSSHYIRCEDGFKPEYPTIDVPYEWSFQGEVNIIEVALVGIDKEPHPYTLDNKNSTSTFDANALIFKQDQRNVLFFRLTEEDYRNGFKSFLIEYIKSKQDDVITKELIRTRQLDQSMLRFTRIIGVGKDNFIRDESSTQYSTVMQEAYGDVEVEHIGPRYGPMCGEEMVYAIIKGRILKNDLTINVDEPNMNWNYQVTNFTKSGNVIYFTMPAFPRPELNRVTAYISINYKGSPIDRFSYLYNGSLDQELAALRLDDAQSTATATSSQNTFNAFDFFSATGAVPTPGGRKKSTAKSTKRLIKNLSLSP